MEGRWVRKRGGRCHSGNVDLPFIFVLAVCRSTEPDGVAADDDEVI